MKSALMRFWALVSQTTGNTIARKLVHAASPCAPGSICLKHSSDPSSFSALRINFVARLKPMLFAPAP